MKAESGENDKIRDSTIGEFPDLVVAFKAASPRSRSGIRRSAHVIATARISVSRK
jgi:hypothetical protein